LKKEGDAFNAGEPLCEISTAGLLIAFESEQAGVLIEKLVNEGQIVEVHEPIAHAAINKRAYSDYIDHKRIESIEERRNG
jgi:pyruvate/2-oxoglutarate dehydrogenase complex dihydrolipoamide acyltransferase (E2) component